MFDDLAGVRAAISKRLKPLLPAGWKVSPYFADAPAESLAAGLYFEFTGFASTVNGQQIPPGQIGAAVDLLVVTKYTDNKVGENNVDDLALKLIRVIDTQPDMFWSDAEKARAGNGPLFWRIHTIALTTA